ncbi:MAG: toprim domain-containing protein [Oscillospiraceae bacterium]|nr:toprim domain-containing protein [Oscillospiraceae bacterium]
MPAAPAAPASPTADAYGNDSITSLKGADRVRLRPGVIFGSDGLEGCEHSIFEILSNSIDEAREGYGDLIEVWRYKDRSVKVRDNGRGIPLDYNQREGRYNWELVYCELYAGGKYANNDADGYYEYSLGLNGLGCCATQYSSEFFDVTVYRDGHRFDLHFERGEVAGELARVLHKSGRTGTIQHWRPDTEVFTDIAVSLEYYTNTLKKQAIVNAGITFILHDEESGEDFTFCYPDGIAGYLAESCGEGALTPVRFYEASTSGRDREDRPEYKLKIQVAFCFHNDANILEYYHNSSWLEHGGAPDRAVRSAFVYEVDRCLRQRGKYTKDEAKVTFGDVAESLALVTNSMSTESSYENQTKKAITNKFIAEAMTDYIKQWLEVYFIESRAEGDRVLEQVLLNKRSRETAEKTRAGLRKRLSAGVDISNRVKKFVDCRSKDIERRELYIVEGDSALGACKLGRDAEFQAIMPLRGKILNCLKADLGNIFKNEVITDLLRVLGCGVEVKARHMHAKDIFDFDIGSLRWNKIIICTDADVDGYQIRALVLTMLYRLMPTLIGKGRIYIAESPLYEITSKNKTFFAYDEREKAKILTRIGGAKYTIQRSKGLGENEPDMMWETTMNPETRRLIKIMPSDIEATRRYFDFLLGDNLAGRKEFIEMNGHLYLDQLDVV